ncbi:hypothetical protein ACFYNO_09265 [Kitasatospora sp. NPDC006697]|uniref:hypothetical protein n=1 Tax=Kitasatospora sp. NPDC006697 TaxID=3364020 RepID=UPI00369683AA
MPVPVRSVVAGVGDRLLPTAAPDVTGADDLDPVVGDGGDGPSEDHGDRGNAQLPCH